MAVAARSGAGAVRGHGGGNGGVAVTDDPRITRYATMRVRMVRPGYVGIQISAREYVMSVSEANELIGMINRAKHDGPSLHDQIIEGLCRE